MGLVHGNRGRSLVAFGVVCLAGCNRYDMFRVSGYEQVSFSNRADVLFVIDNSPTMQPAASSLATNFAEFVSSVDPGQQQLTYDGVKDAVDNYIEYVQDRGSFLDFRFSIVTHDVNATQSELLGPTLKRGDPDVTMGFLEQITCGAICISGALPSAPQGYQCGDLPGENLSQEFLDCTCGAGGYLTSCGEANEEPLEAVLLAMCRAVENPPVACFEDVVTDDSDPKFPVTLPALLNEDDAGTAKQMMRDGVTFFPIIVSDEGDDSRRELLFGSRSIPLAYEQLFSQFDKRMVWVDIGPNVDPDDPSDTECPSPVAGIHTVDRLDYLVQTTGGAKIDIYDDNCRTRDFAEALGELSNLLNNLVASFPLAAIPVPGSIVVVVGGKVEDEAEEVGVDQRFGFPVYSDGWTYRSSDNSIVFHGAAIPQNDENVEVFYDPVDGMPRDLPF
jgi:hypothetical protein